MGEVTRLAPVELVSFDTSKVRALARSLGRDQARRVTTDVIAAISERLSMVEAAWAEGAFATIARIAHSLVGMAGQVGLLTLVEVAQRTVDAARTGDAAATAAVVSRLARVGEASLATLLETGEPRV